MLSNLKISRKLFLAFSTIMLVILLAYAMLWSSKTEASGANAAQASNFLASIQAERMRASLYRQQNAIGNNLLTGEARFLKTYAEAKQGFQTAADTFVQLSGSSDQNTKIKAAKAFVETWWTNAGDRMVALGGNPETRTAALALPKQFPLTTAYDLLDDALTVQAALIAENAAAADAAKEASSMTMAGSLALLAAIAIAMGVLLSRTISRPTVRLTEVMRRLAEGDRTVAVAGSGRRDEIGAMAAAVQIFKDAAIQKDRLEAEAETNRAAQAEHRHHQSAIDNAKAEDLRAFVHMVEEGFERLSNGDLTVRMDGAVAEEFEPIRQTFNVSVEALEGTIGAVVGAIGLIRLGLGEISAASTDLAQRTEQQAASLEETVAALSEVTRAVNGTAEGASRATGAARATEKNAASGGLVVSKAVAAMAEIEQSSDKISKIIGVIDEIAFQTNLLALNAGVEAARAGEAGRGFAVVAQEVRGLAQRSAEAAKEIKDLISTSAAQVATGVDLVTASGRSLDEIAGQVTDMNRIVAQIAKSAGEQAVSLREVSAAADQMDKVTQQNAAMVEETTAAARNLSDETEELATLTQRFRTRAGDGRASKPPARMARPATASRPVPQMRAQGAGGAARQAQPSQDGWEEF